MANDESRELDVIRKRNDGAEAHWLRRTAGRTLKIVGDAAKAFFGDKGNDLQANLHNLGETLDGKAPSDLAGVHLLQHDRRWLEFQTRFEVTRELMQLIPEIARPVGWSHVLRIPLPRARELLQIVADDLSNRLAWRMTIRDCEGYVTELESLVHALQELGAQPPQSSETDQERVGSIRSRARMALDSVSAALTKLVYARDDYAQQVASDASVTPMRQRAHDEEMERRVK